MRNIKKDFTTVPLSLKEQSEKLKNVTSNTPLKYDGEDVKIALFDLYHGKCAYCEQLSNLEIEHYRPKEAYFWLKIEWTNLLYSCHDCNRVGSKGALFPTLKDKISTPELTTNGFPTHKHTYIYELDKIEQPLLLNPEVTNPYYHLRIDKFGKLIEIDNSRKGKETSIVCRLNRDALHRKRAKIINDFINRIQQQIAKRYREVNPLNAEQLKEQLFLIFEDIAKQGNELMEFTMISYSFIQYFDDMVLDNFEPEFHDIILTAFIEFCENV